MMYRNRPNTQHTATVTPARGFAPRRALLPLVWSVACAALSVAGAAPGALAMSQSQMHTAAALAEAAYPKKQDIVHRPTLRKFPRRGPLVNSANGFSGAIFEGRKTIYVAFAGTDQVIDVASDAQLASWFGKNKSLINLQIAAAKRLTRRAIATNPRRKKIIVVGHSLGGYLAQVVTAEMPVSAGITFNAPGFGPTDRGKMFIPKNSARLMTNFSRERDVVGNFGKHFGRKRVFHDVVSEISNHGITGFRKDIAAGMRPYRDLLRGTAVFAGKTLRGKASKKCIQIGKPGTEGKNARIRTCNGKKWTQRWTLRKSGILHLGNVRGKNGHKPRCLEARQAKKGIAVQVGECHGLKNQRWTWHKGRIRGVHGKFKNLCVDVRGAKTRSGTRLILWPCHNRANQKWATRG